MTGKKGMSWAKGKDPKRKINFTVLEDDFNFFQNYRQSTGQKSWKIFEEAMSVIRAKYRT